MSTFNARASWLTPLFFAFLSYFQNTVIMLKRTLFLLSFAAGTLTFAGQNQVINADAIVVTLNFSNGIPQATLKLVLKLAAQELNIPYPDASSAYDRGLLTVEQPDLTTDTYKITYGGQEIFIVLEDI